jgi:hypothetical protein
MTLTLANTVGVGLHFAMTTRVVTRITLAP